MVSSRSVHLFAFGLVLAVQPVIAQVSPLRDTDFVLPAAQHVQASDSLGPSPGRAFVYSAVVPGAGQWRMGEHRWIGYVALEIGAWLHYLDRRTASVDLERRYRDLAWKSARQKPSGPRKDGDFGYYEALGRYVASGAYDADPTRAGVQPETSVDTYNGSVWALARAMYFPADAESMPEDSPEYERALSYYRARAVAPEFAWSWESPAAQETFRETMKASDEALRSATRTLGLILANHVVSAIDALIAARIRDPRDPEPPFKFESTLDIRDGQTSWSAAIRVRWPRR